LSILKRTEAWGAIKAINIITPLHIELNDDARTVSAAIAVCQSTKVNINSGGILACWSDVMFSLILDNPNILIPILPIGIGMVFYNIKYTRVEHVINVAYIESQE
jgi:hypothetical protein